MKQKKQKQHRRTELKTAEVESASRPATFATWKKLVFAAIACGGFFLLIELFLAVVGVKPVLFERDPYVGFSSRIPLFVSDEGKATGEMLVTAKNKRRIFNVQRFAARKPSNTYRIFCMGGSTTYGHPYSDPTSFCGWLRAMLPKADPSRQWEVINCGGISYASYREALLMEELIQYQPDLFIVLSGHNEFLEQRTYSGIIAMPEALRGVGALLSKTRLYGAFSIGFDALSPNSKPRPFSTNALPAEVQTLLDRSLGPQAYIRDDAWRNQVIAHFRYNLARMADIARSAGAEVIFVTPASNLRNCAPFKSEHRPGMTPGALQEWEALVRGAMQHQQNGKPVQALADVDQAVKLDDRRADLHYLRGHALWDLQRFAEAESSFLRALDEDICPLRTLTPMLDALKEVAALRRVPVVDFVKLTKEKATHGVPGEDWFLDHVHPTIEGNREVALAILDTMSQQGITHPVASWNEPAKLEIKRSVENQITPHEHGVALCTLAKVMAWAGKAQEAYRLALRAEELVPDDPAVQFEAGKNAAKAGHREEAVQHLRKTLSLQPDFVEAKALLAGLLMEIGQADDAISQMHEAVSRRPNDPELHGNLGALFLKQGKLDEAAASFRTALQIAPNYAEAQNNLGWALKRQGQFSEALRHFREAVRLRPGLPSAAIGLAWILATHPDPASRDAQESIRLGERLVEHSAYKNWMSLDTLGAAYAAAGRYPEAVTAAEKALKIVRSASAADTPAVANRLALYQQGRPYIESTRMPAQPSGSP